MGGGVRFDCFGCFFEGACCCKQRLVAVDCKVCEEEGGEGG